MRVKAKTSKPKPAEVDSAKMIRFFRHLSRALETLNDEEKKRITNALVILYGTPTPDKERV